MSSQITVGVDGGLEWVNVWWLCSFRPSYPPAVTSSPSLPSHSRFSTAGCCSRAASWRLDAWLPRWLRMLPQDPGENQEVVTSLRGELLLLFFCFLCVCFPGFVCLLTWMMMKRPDNMWHAALKEPGNFYFEINKTRSEALKKLTSYQSKAERQTIPFSTSISFRLHYFVALAHVISCVLLEHKNVDVCLPHFQVWSGWISVRYPNSLWPLLLMKVCLNGPHPPLFSTLNHISSEGFVKLSLWVDCLYASLNTWALEYK